MTLSQIDQFFICLATNNPKPNIELIYNNTFTLLIAVLLSARSTDAEVNKVTSKLFTIANTPELMIILGEIRLKNYIKTIGLFNNKAKNIITLSHILIKQHQSQVPQNFEELQKLPGVGRKTANVVLNAAFNQPTIAVDTHVFRVANRTGISLGTTTKIVEIDLERIIPDKWKSNAHNWLILLGRYICKAKKPNCPICPVVNLCMFSNKIV
ncbi:MAG: endonuclease III, partial [Rhodospirillaceae bacterium]|nr:endonuclease III [Rhodospirillaceae bacterium]